MTQPSYLSAFTFMLIASFTPVTSLGSASTAAVVSSTATVCGIVATEPSQRIRCYQNNSSSRFLVSVEPDASFESISGGETFFCGLLTGGWALLCWDTSSSSSYAASFEPKRIYYSETVALTDLTVGNRQVCAREVDTRIVRCWRGDGKGHSLFPSPGDQWTFSAITSGSGFTCGILKNDSTVLCWGSNAVGAEIQRQFHNSTMLTLVAGVSHACGLTVSGFLVCRGNNDHGQLVVPFISAFEFSSVALGANYSCAIRRRNGQVVCWGGETDRFEYDYPSNENLSFESIVSGSDFICGLISWNLTIICWGPGWSTRDAASDVPLGTIIPGPCVKTTCAVCGTYPDSDTLCHGSGTICRSCLVELPLALPLPPTVSPPMQGSQQPLPRPGRSLSRLAVAFCIVGSVGALMGTCTIVFCLRSGDCGFFGKKMDHSVSTMQEQEQVPGSSLDTADIGSTDRTLRPVSYMGQSSGFSNSNMSGSSSKHMCKTENFSLSQLMAATNDFSLENMIGSGSFGMVYRGKLADGRLVAIKRGRTSPAMINIKSTEEKESAFGSELVLLSRLNHRHLVGLVGFCEEGDERLLVYEYMRKGSLHDHLHCREDNEGSSEILRSWRTRIKVALDAARGIEYLHNYAVPPIIHRDIKSSNILLDADWTARVSDFGLSLMGPESEQECMPSKAAGTVGYIDPEYYVMNMLTTKSDVYSLGVVLLELLTGKRAVFKDEDGSGPIGLVDYARQSILAGELRMVLDTRAVPAAASETRAVELLAHVAMECVSLEGQERPDMSKIVADLERAMALCE